MSQKRNIWIAAIVLIVIGLYAYVYRDWFRPQEIEVSHRIIVGPPIRGSLRTNQATTVTQLVFGFDRKFQFTEIKVIPVAVLETNKNPLPLWHLLSYSNAVPLKAFAYGDHIRGLRPVVKKSRPMALEPNVTYRLIIKAGREKGEHDFRLGENIVVGR